MNYEEEKREIDLMEYWRVIEKRKWIAVTIASTVVLLTAVFSFTAIPYYKASATLFFEEEASRIMSIQDEFGNSRQVRDMFAFNTQLEMLKSKSLAVRVAERMNLSSHSELLEGIKPKRNFLSTIKNIITLRWLLSGNRKNKKQNSEPQSNPSSGYAGLIRANLEVSPVSNTKLVKIRYSSRIPRLSAEIANTYAGEFRDFAHYLKYERTEKFSNDLAQQIEDLRSQLEDARRQRQKYATDRNLILRSTESEESSSAYSDYQRTSDAYTQKMNERQRIGAILAQVRDSDIDLLARIDYPRIQQQQTEYLNAKNTYDGMSQYLANHPERVKALEQLKRAEKNLEQAVDYIESDYQLALREENILRNQMERQESEIVKVQSDIGVYRTLNVKVQSLDAQLINLERLKNELDAAKGLESLKESNISIVDPAEVPRNPYTPNKSKNLFLALLFGAFGGIGLCFLLEYLDNTVKGPEEVEKIAGLPSLGVIPFLEQEDIHGKGRHYTEYGSGEGKRGLGIDETKPNVKDIELINHFYPRLPIADDFRTLRTSILLSYANSPPKVIAFTSSLPEEGKSATLVNLSVAFAQLEKKVLVVDSDIRKPRLHRIFKIGNIGGLSGYLSGKTELKEAIQKTSINNIWLLPSGPVPPNPSELLNSIKMKEMLEEVKKVFDIIMLDTPPVLATIDAVIISTLVDSTVMILKAGEITRKPFMSAVEELRRANAKIIGVVFNGLKASEGKYFYRGYYPYYRYGYYDSKELKSYMDGER